MDDMDGSLPVLRLVNPAGGIQLVGQAVEQGGVEMGSVEHAALTVPPGASAELAYRVPAATVLEDQRIEAWVWCSRPGLRLAANVVLPRSIDESTGAARELVVRSEAIAEGGSWQRLVLDDTPTLVARHARVARAKFGPTIDETGAFVSAVVFLTPGGTGVTELWVDKVALFGALRPGGAEGPGKAHDTSQPIDLAAAWAGTGPASTGVHVDAPRQAPPATPRIIQWQGEPFAFLQRLGFDAVWMGRLPNDAELREAQRLGLWIVCPPPTPEALAARGIGSELNPVLAWDLGELASPDDVQLAEQWALLLEQRDPVTTRPTVLRPVAMPREASRIAEVVVLGKPTVGATATWPEHASWLSHMRQQGRPGTVLWLAVDTHLSTNAAAQLAALRGGPPLAGAASYEHLSLATTAALAARPQGFWFQSHGSLAANNAESRKRALALQLSNMRLRMIEPWLAGGGATAVRSSLADVTAMELSVERSRLIVPMWWSSSAPGIAAATAAQASPANGVGSSRGAAQPVTFLLPSVPESCRAYLLSIAGPRQLTTRRVTGGLSVAADRLPEDAFVLLTEDGQAFAQVERYLRTCAPLAAQGRVELAALESAEAARATVRLSPGLLQAADAQRVLASVSTSLTAAQRALAAQDFGAAFSRAAVAQQTLDRLRSRLLAVMWPDGLEGASPLRGGWSALPDLERASLAIAASGSRPEPIPAGGFESLESLVENGWQRSDGVQPGVDGYVRLSPETPHGGSHCLELEARTTAAGPPSLATPPVWITSPPLRVPAGHLLEITGWARVAETPMGSSEPLLVFDSIGGEESAVRIAAAPSWRPFRLVRAAPPGAECRVTIALGGIGRAAVDSLQCRFVPIVRGQ
jgi:hypothetical protein